MSTVGSSGSATSSGPIAASSATASSIDVASIVSQLMTVESQPVTLLQQQESGYQSQITALGSVQSAVSSFQTAMQGLAGLSQYQAMNATSSSPSVGVTAASGAATGSYSVSVSALAQAQSIVTAGQASTTAPIGTGASTTLTFSFGTISGGTLSNGVYSGATFTPSSSGTKTVTINSSNNSLSGIANAINSANIGVTATIVNNGSPTTPYQLVLTGPSGASSSMDVSVSGDATLSSLLTYNPAGTQDMTQTVAAQNAQMMVNGIPISQSTNTVSNAVSGLTFNLSGVTSSPATVSVTQNTSGIVSAVNSFVSAYNSLNTAIQGVAGYNSSTNSGGPLMGDPMVMAIENQIRNVMDQPVNGTTSLYSTLSQIGVTFQKDGTLAVDNTKLTNAISSSPSDIASLFSTVGKASDSLVSYVASSNVTQPGTYAVNVTQMAAQGSLTGSSAANLTITKGTNDTLNLTVDGIATSVVIPAGTYTASSLATELQSLINGSSAMSSAGQSVGVIQNSGVLTITSGAYGSSSAVAVTGGDASTGLMGSAPVQKNGLDVAGTINGEAATGTGQVLTSAAGNSSGLAIQINGGTTGSRGTVSFSQGYAVTLNNLANSLLDPYSGPIATETKGINTTINNINTQISNWQARLALIQQSLTTQYSSLDAMLGTMSQTSSYLTQQLARLP